MFTIDQASKLYCLSDTHAYVYRLAERNQPLFWDSKNIEWHRTALQDLLISLGQEWFLIIGTAIERMMDPSYPHTGEAPTFYQIRDFFIAHCQTHCLKLSWDDAMAQWQLRDKFQQGGFVTAVAVEYWRIFPFVLKYKKEQFIGSDASYLTPESWRNKHTLDALNAYAFLVAQASHHSSIIKPHNFTQVHDMVSSAPGQAPSIFGNPFQMRDVWHATTCAWALSKLGLTLPVFTPALLDTIQSSAAKLSTAVDQLCKARRVKTFAPVNHPPLIPHACRVLLSAPLEGRDLSELLLQMRRVAETVSAPARRRAPPAEFAVLPVIPLEQLDALLATLITGPRAQPKDTTQTLAEDLGLLSVEAPDPWTERIPFTDAALSKLSHERRDDHLARGIETFLRGQPHELRMAIWDMRVGARPAHCPALALSVPACEPLRVDRGMLAAASVGDVTVYVMEALEKVGRGEGGEEYMWAAAYLRGLAWARGVEGV